ncbi:MAG: hypothetical protein GY754_17965 [bacterium]|nr:hypothetical protein [bacterium]
MAQAIEIYTTVSLNGTINRLKNIINTDLSVSGFIDRSYYHGTITGNQLQIKRNSFYYPTNISGTLEENDEGTKITLKIDFHYSIRISACIVAFAALSGGLIVFGLIDFLPAIIFEYIWLLHTIVLSLLLTRFQKTYLIRSIIIDFQDALGLDTITTSNYT